MNLGLKRNEVKLVPHNQKWSKEFMKVQIDIQTALDLDFERIEHIGSTAIKEIAAKPILDILVGVDNLEEIEETLFHKFKKIGFYRLKVERENEIVLAKFKDDSFNEKTHFIHLVQFEGEKWRDLIFFRDCLNSSESLRKEYEQIKISFVAKQNTGINEYTDAKENFVKRVFDMNK